MTKKERIAAIRLKYLNRLKLIRDNATTSEDVAVAAGLACLVAVSLEDLRKADGRRKGYNNYVNLKVEVLEKAFNECES